MISADAQRIGERLAHEGVLGRFAIDFVVMRSGEGSWTTYAIELNLRKGGTTHPFLTLQFLTSAEYNRLHPDSASFVTALYSDVLGRDPSAAELKQLLAAAGTRVGGNTATASGTGAVAVGGNVGGSVSTNVNTRSDQS